MKIVVCGSMSSSEKMVEVKNELNKAGHEVLIPKHAEKFASGEFSAENRRESTEHKIREDLIRDYYQEIKNCDALLAVNLDKEGVENYIGGNVFLEMGFAHVLEKPIYLLNDVPKMIYTDEILAMQPVVLRGDLRNISSPVGE